MPVWRTFLMFVTLYTTPTQARKMTWYPMLMKNLCLQGHAASCRWLNACVAFCMMNWSSVLAHQRFGSSKFIMLRDDTPKDCCTTYIGKRLSPLYKKKLGQATTIRTPMALWILCPTIQPGMKVLSGAPRMSIIPTEFGTRSGSHICFTHVLSIPWAWATHWGRFMDPYTMAWRQLQCWRSQSKAPPAHMLMDVPAPTLGCHLQRQLKKLSCQTPKRTYSQFQNRQRTDHQCGRVPW
jgi:hypothetical protein